MARALLLAAALVACHCTAQAQRAPPGGSDVPSCDDTCQCSEQEGCGANNGVCDEAVAVSSQINEGSYDKSRGCVAGHCCTDGTDGSDCIAAGHPCRLTQSAPGPSTTSGPPVPPAPAPPETQNTGPITRYIVYAYLMVGWLYLKGKLPAVEGEVTERQVEQARRKHMGIKGYRYMRRVKICVVNLAANFAFVSVMPPDGRSLLAVVILLAIAANLFFPDKFRPVWWKLLGLVGRGPGAPQRVAPAEVQHGAEGASPRASARQTEPPAEQPDWSGLVATSVATVPTLIAAAVPEDAQPSGSLRKLGGKNKDKWQDVEATLSESGMAWTLGSGLRDTLAGAQRELPLDSILSVNIWSDIGIEHGFEVASTVKGGKVYKFCAADDATRDRWMDAIEIATGGASGAHSPVVVVVESDLTVDRPLTSLQTVKVVHSGIAIGYDVTDQEPQPEPEPEPEAQPVGLSADASASVSAVSNPLSQAAAFEVEDSVQPSAETLTTTQSDAQPQVAAAHVEDDA